MNTILLAMVLTQTLSGLGKWKQLGTWKPNVAKSTYAPGPRHRAMVLKFSAQGEAVRSVLEGIHRAGKAVHGDEVDYVGGHERPYQGYIRNADPYIARRWDDYTTVHTWKKDGKVVFFVHSLVSADGQSLVIVATGTDRQGRAFREVLTFESQ